MLQRMPTCLGGYGPSHAHVSYNSTVICDPPFDGYMASTMRCAGSTSRIRPVDQALGHNSHVPAIAVCSSHNFKVPRTHMPCLFYAHDWITKVSRYFLFLDLCTEIMLLSE